MKATLLVLAICALFAAAVADTQADYSEYIFLRTPILWIIGEQQHIEWDISTFTPPNFPLNTTGTLSLMKSVKFWPDSKVKDLVSNVAVNGEALVTVPQLDDGDNYYLQFESNERKFGFKVRSADTFSVRKKGFIINFPNIASVWKAGTEVKMTWVAKNVDPKELVTIYIYQRQDSPLIKDNILVAQTTYNDGSHNFIIPTNLTTIKLYGKIEQAIDKGNAFDRTEVFTTSLNTDCQNYRDETIAVIYQMAVFGRLGLDRTFDTCGALWETAWAADSGVTHAEIVVSKKLKTIVVAIQGSDLGSIGDWMTNFRADLVQYNNTFFNGWGRVHRGWLMEYSYVRDSIVSTLQSLIGNSENFNFDRIILTGFGQGGAQVTVGALDIAGLFPCNAHKIKVITFGAPIAGDQDFVNAYNERVPLSIRYVSSGLAGPDFASSIRLLGYSHVNTQVMVKGGALSPFDAHNVWQYISAIVDKKQGRDALKNVNPIQPKCRGNPSPNPNPGPSGWNPTINVLAPGNPRNPPVFLAGQPVTISYRTQQVDPTAQLKVTLFTCNSCNGKDGRPITSVVDRTYNTGSFIWNIPTTDQVLGANRYFVISTQDGKVVSDELLLFSIARGKLADGAISKNPQQDVASTISWRYIAPPGSTVKIELFRKANPNNPLQTLVTKWPIASSFIWTPADDLSTTIKDYMIKITMEQDPLVYTTTTTFTVAPSPNVNCEVGKWTSWSACNVSCGDGVMIRGRNVTTYPAGKGKPCPPTFDTMPCKAGACRGTTFNIDYQGILKAHNQARYYPYRQLRKMLWDPDLQAGAQAYALNCINKAADAVQRAKEYAYSRQVPYTGSSADSVGESLLAFRSNEPPKIDQWIREGNSFSCMQNKCQSGNNCNRYTQLIDRDAVRVGCAAALCSSDSPFGSGSWVNFICRYNTNYNGTYHPLRDVKECVQFFNASAPAMGFSYSVHSYRVLAAGTGTSTGSWKIHPWIRQLGLESDAHTNKIFPAYMSPNSLGSILVEAGAYTNVTYLVGGNSSGSISIDSIAYSVKPTTTPTLGSGIKAYTSNRLGAPGFVKESRVVFLAGAVQADSWTTGKYLFTLPMGYTPESREVFAVVGSNGQVAANIDVDSKGVVKVSAPSPQKEQFLSLDNIRFLVGNTKWNSLSLGPGCSAAGMDLAQPGVFDDGPISIRGVIKGCKSNVLATLPAKFRPTGVRTFPVACSGPKEQACRVDILPTGVIQVNTDGKPRSDSPKWISLSGIYYDQTPDVPLD